MTTSCHQCGKLFPVELAMRRDVQVGSVSGFDPKTGAALGGSTWQRVDLCPRCDEQAKADGRGFMTGIGIAALGALLVALFVAGYLVISALVSK